MRAVFSYLLILSAFCFSYKHAVASPENRCRVKHCLCKVRGDVGRNKLPPVKEFKSIKTQTNKYPDLKNKSESKAYLQNALKNQIFPKESYNKAKVFRRKALQNQRFPYKKILKIRGFLTESMTNQRFA